VKRRRKHLLRRSRKKKSQPPKLIVGLGNPGARYQETRHNIGFLLIQEVFIPFYRLQFKKNRWDGVSSCWETKERDIHFLMPQTFMNRSAKAVLPYLKNEEIALENLLILVDDMDLIYGKIRFREEGSSGGHLGLQSLIEGLGTQNFARLRLGIGRPNSKGEVTDFVLEKFNQEEKDILPSVFEKSRRVVESWIEEGPKKARDTLSRLS